MCHLGLREIIMAILHHNLYTSSLGLTQYYSWMRDETSSKVFFWASHTDTFYPQRCIQACTHRYTEYRYVCSNTTKEHLVMGSHPMWWDSIRGSDQSHLQNLIWTTHHGCDCCVLLWHPSRWKTLITERQMYKTPDNIIKSSPRGCSRCCKCLQDYFLPRWHTHRLTQGDNNTSRRCCSW